MPLASEETLREVKDAVVDGVGLGGTVAQGDRAADATKPWYMALYSAAGTALAAAIADDAPASALLMAAKNAATSKLTALLVGAHGGLVVEGVASGVAVPISGTVTAAVAAGSNTIGAVTGPSAAPLALDATLTGGSQKAKVVDQGLAFIAGGTTNCTTATQVATGQTGEGYLTISNLDTSATIYMGLTGVTSGTGIPIPPNGGSRTVRYTAIETIYAIGSASVGWAVER